MIVRFSVENWSSFNHSAVLNMVATPEKQHRERLGHIRKFGARVLPVAAIFGSNGAGKSNLVSALLFAQQFLLMSPPAGSPIRREPFALSKQRRLEPTVFEFALLIKELLYTFSFSVTDTEVIRESLTVQNSSSQYDVYSRNGQQFSFGDWFQKKNQTAHLELIARSTRPNVLFLSNAVNMQADGVQPVFDWFRHSLVVITPRSQFLQLHRFADASDAMYPELNKMLEELDTGIDHLSEKEIPTSLSGEIRALIEQQLTFTPAVRIDDVVYRKVGNDLVGKQIVSIHPSWDGTPIPFPLSAESDGTNRLLDLIPVFLRLADSSANPMTVVIDELDRSLHANISLWLLHFYLDKCNASSRSQLIFTTHDVNLIDQKTLRRDELWITERNSKGESRLYSFGDFKDVRNDKDIRKSYLHGLLGGVPNVVP